MPETKPESEKAGEPDNEEDTKEEPTELASSSSKQCFNENLVHEKDKKKAKKKVSAKHLLKLEKSLKECAKEIKKLEEAEVDWDDDDESNYILCAKYKRRYMELFRKIAEQKELSSSLDRKSEKKFICGESRYPEINKKIQKFVNRTKQFPDFHDIKKLVRAANTTLHLNAIQVNDEAENIFQAVGKKLKNRRAIDEAEVLESYLKEDQMEDPAAKNEDLNKKLIVQAAEGKDKINKYFDDFYKTHVVNANTSEEIKNSGINDVEKDNITQSNEKTDEKTESNVSNCQETNNDSINNILSAEQLEKTEMNSTSQETNNTITPKDSSVVEAMDVECEKDIICDKGHSDDVTNLEKH